MDADFLIPRQVKYLMHAYSNPWFVAGGWAIDLFLKRVTRKHKDIEIGIFRSDQLLLHKYLKEWLFKKVKKQSAEKRGQLEEWQETEYLELPTHEIHATRRLHLNQTLRVCPGTQNRISREYSTSNLPELEVLLNERDDSCWIYRRNFQIRRELSKTILYTKTGIPYLAPEIVILYKSKNPNPDDEFDFNNTVNNLGYGPRAWLATSIEITKPGHQWLDRLA